MRKHIVLLIHTAHSKDIMHSQDSPKIPLPWSSCQVLARSIFATSQHL